jgi:hypothetical protein
MKKVLVEEINKTRKLMNLQEQSISDFLDSFKTFFGFDDSKDKSEDDVKEIGDDKDFYQEILKGIGAPVTKDNMEFMYAWRQSEGGEARNNPFNTTHDKPGSTFYNCLSKGKSGQCIHGVKNYKTERDGVDATISTLKNGKYNNIIDALKKGNNSMSTAMALKNSPWGTGDLTIKVLKGYQSGATPKPPKIA